MERDWKGTRTKSGYNAYNQILADALPEALRNFIANFFSNLNNPPYRIVVTSPFGIRYVDGWQLHHGVDFAYSGLGNGWAIGVADYTSTNGSILASTILSTGYGDAVWAVYEEDKPPRRFAVTIVRQGSHYGWMSNFQSSRNNAIPIQPDNLKWNISFSHLAGPPFAIRSELLQNLNNNGSTQKVINGRNYTFFKQNGKLTHIFCRGCGLIDIYKDLAGSHIYMINSVNGDTVYKYRLTDLNKKIKTLAEDKDKFFSMYGSPGLIFERSFQAGGLSQSDRDAFLNQKVGFVMGSTGLSKGPHYHVNLMYQCHYLNILEAIPDNANIF